MNAIPAPLARRDFLQSAALASGMVLASPAPEGCLASGAGPVGGLVDTNVHLSRWPCRRLPQDETPSLVGKLRVQGVTEAWACSFDALLHRDLGAVNASLARECRSHGAGMLVPFGAINPALPDWEEDLRRCAEEHGMPGVRLYPGYHGYALDDPGLARLLELAAARGLVVQLCHVMEDRRMMHPLLQVEPPALAPLPAVVKRTPRLRLQLLGMKTAPSPELLEAGDVCLEISMIEGVGGVGTLLGKVPVERVLFGSHAPLFYLEAAVLKLRESELTDAQQQAIRWGNARRLAGLHRQPGAERDHS